MDKVRRIAATSEVFRMGSRWYRYRQLPNGMWYIQRNIYCGWQRLAVGSEVHTYLLPGIINALRDDVPQEG